MKNEITPTGMLNLHRFNGTETYEIETAEVRVGMDNGFGKFALLSITTSKTLKTLEDTAELGAQPEASISLYLSGPWEVDLIAGAELVVPAAHDEQRGWVVEFSYVSFEDLDRNRIKILKREGDLVELNWQGETQDMNFYDGSKPPAKFDAQCWAKIISVT